ncbi:MAG: N-acetylneuraminate synthase family protein [Phycisphaerales bacterium]|nr:N-acetylneuraminate synthase family protein [Phycisphaerales bacterium]
MTTHPAIQIGSRFLGENHPCFIAAEIGINHNGDLDLAREMIVSAAKAGADGVKFQNYRTEDFIADRTLDYRYISQGEEVVESQYDMFKRYEMPREWLPELKKCCDMQDVEFFSTPTSDRGIQDLLKVDVELFKNGSDYLGHLPLIKSFARSGIPTVLSTGMAELDEIDAAVEAFREAGGEGLVLLHCTSSYPTPLDEANLNRMVSLADRYGCAIGFSDHTDGTRAAELASAMGAVFIEKHFTTSRDLPGPDHRFSSTPEELERLIQNVRDVSSIMGSSSIESGDVEQLSRTQFRLSCHVSRAMTAGSHLSAEDITISRPADGLPPSRAEDLIGQSINRDLEAGEAITSECLDSDQ